MRIFLSYASDDEVVAQEIEFALRGAGHEVFFGSQSIPAGGDYNSQIRDALERADYFVFLISPASVRLGRYTLSELGAAKAKWPHAREGVLPVVVGPADLTTVDPYLRSVKILEPTGAAAPEVVASLARLASPRGDAFTSPRGTARVERSLRHVEDVLERIAQLHSAAVAAGGLADPDSIYRAIVLGLTPEYGPEKLEVPDGPLYRELREVLREVEKASRAVRLAQMDLQHGHESEEVEYQPEFASQWYRTQLGNFKGVARRLLGQ